MLTSLHIKNYVLIDHLDFSPVNGLNIITGETGAGKSILLGAIGLLLGQRADSKTLLNTEKKCIIEGIFKPSNQNNYTHFLIENDIEIEEEYIIRREISSNGKSRAFINDSPVTLDILKKLTSEFIDIHSQHDTLLIGEKEYQLKIIDIYGQHQNLVASYQKDYQIYQDLQKKIKSLESTFLEQSKQNDYIQFLLNELIEADLKEDEQPLLEEKLKKIENAEVILLKLKETEQAFDNNSEFSIIHLLNQAKKSIQSITPLSKAYENLYDRVEAILAESKDIHDEIIQLAESVEINPEEQLNIEQRLDLIYKLQTKHQVKTNAQLIELKDQIDQQLNQTSDLENNINALKKEVITLEKKVNQQAEKLHDKRLPLLNIFKDDLVKILHQVGIINAQIEINCIKRPQLNSTGNTDIEILFSANKGVKVQNLKNAASGGEFSRLMLGIKYLIAEKTALPSIIFDEIDTGISGEIAIKVGEILSNMGKNMQVFCITHLPQIAALGENHYFVYKDHEKDITSSKMRKLDLEERVKEVAQMIGGNNITQAALDAANALFTK